MTKALLVILLMMAVAVQADVTPAADTVKATAIKPDDKPVIERLKWVPFDSVRASYLRGAAGALVVCDVTQRATLGTIGQYVEQIRVLNPRAVIDLAANKQDLADQRALSEDELARAAADVGAGYFPTSAKTGSGVEEAFRHLGRVAIGA